MRTVSLTVSWLLSAVEKSKAKSQVWCHRVQRLLQETVSPWSLPITYMVVVAHRDTSQQALTQLSSVVQLHQEAAPHHLTPSIFTLTF